MPSENNQTTGRIAKMTLDGNEGLKVFDDPSKEMPTILYSAKVNSVLAQFYIIFERFKNSQKN